MNKKIFKKLFSLTATAIFAVGAINSHAYYVETNEDLLGEEVFNLDVEDSEEFNDEFLTQNSCSIVDASNETIDEATGTKIPSASAHGKIVKCNKGYSGTILRSNYKALGYSKDIPEGEELASVKRVAFQVDILLGSDMRAGGFQLRANDLQLRADGTTYYDGNNSIIMTINYDATAKRDGTETSKAIQAVAYDDNEGTMTAYRIAELEAKKWYTFTILFDVSADDRSNHKRSIWIDDELVAENWIPHQSGSLWREGATIQLINGLIVQGTSADTDTDVYLDNIRMWKDVEVDEFLETFKDEDPENDAIKTYDGYQSSYSVTASETAASVQFDIVSYMDLNRPVVALAAVYDKRTNTVGTVYYTPLNLIMAETVSDSIGNIVLPQDYNDSDYEIKLYIWDRGDIFAPVFIPESQTEG